MTGGASLTQMQLLGVGSETNVAEGYPRFALTLDNDPHFVGEGDVDAAREIVETVEEAELFLYPGDKHYFADSSLPSYNGAATALLTQRVLAFLEWVCRALTGRCAGARYPL